MRLALAVICFAGPVAAQDWPAQFSLPAGCDAYVTLQSVSCEVTHYFTCTNDPAGHQRSVSLDEDGVSYAGLIDSETQWLESFYPQSGHAERLEPSPEERASFSELLETGEDEYRFRTLSDEIGDTRFEGRDRLTGRTVTIDDVTLEETEYSITAFDAAGNEIWASRGTEYINRDWGRFTSGFGQTTVDGEVFERDRRPMEFIFPGEPGFLSAQPKHGCGVAIS